MKKAVIGILVIGVLTMGTVAFAHMWGGGPGWGYGPMWGSGWSTDPKAAAETYDLRKSLNAKMFDYREAYRTGDTERLEALQKEIAELREQIFEKSGDRGYGMGPGYGMGYGYCGGPGWGGR